MTDTHPEVTAAIVWPSEWQEEQTGGGCMAMTRPTICGGYAMITCDDGVGIPEDPDEPVMLGYYDAEGQSLDNGEAAVMLATTSLALQLFDENAKRERSAPHRTQSPRPPLALPSPTIPIPLHTLAAVARSAASAERSLLDGSTELLRHCKDLGPEAERYRQIWHLIANARAKTSALIDGIEHHIDCEMRGDGR